MKDELMLHEIELSNGDKLTVATNLHEFGMDIQAPLDNWLARTEEFTEKSFCDYIQSKDPMNIVALTHEEIDTINPIE